MPASLASSPNALMFPVTRVDASASPSPAAAARSSTPSRPSMLWSASHEASASWFRASAASTALNVVDAPASLAAFSSLAMSSAEARELARTWDIVPEKSMPSWTVCLMKSLRALVALDNAPVTNPLTLLLRLSNPSLAAFSAAALTLSSAPARLSLNLDDAVFAALPALVTEVFRPSAALPALASAVLRSFSFCFNSSVYFCALV